MKITIEIEGAESPRTTVQSTQGGTQPPPEVQARAAATGALDAGAAPGATSETAEPAAFLPEGAAGDAAGVSAGAAPASEGENNEQ
jgi:hypothetical protein